MVPGDGIGPEVMKQAKALLIALSKKLAIELRVDEADWGAERWLKERVGIPDGILEQLPKNYDAILFGALGDPRIPDMAHGREILLKLRFNLDLYINLRPVKLLNTALTPLKNYSASDIDMVIFRENTEDIYLGLGRNFMKGENEIAIDESMHTFYGVSRIIRAAFEYASKNGRKRVSLIDKSNAIKFGGQLWQRVFKEIAINFPHIITDHLYIDVAAMQMVRNPRHFDVIVTSNLFGDILSDLGAGITGGLGLAASANINPGSMALFEPVHGSAPDIAGQDKANPFAMFLSVSMMMTYFGYHQAAYLIEKSIVNAINNNKTTKDLAGSLSCSAAAQFVIDSL